MSSPHLQDDGSGPGLYSDLVASVPGGARVVGIGDSIMQGGSSAIGIAGSTIESTADCDWLAWACAAMGGGFHYVKNAGIGSNTTTQMLARFATDVVAYSPDVVVIGGGTNDAGVAVSLATFAANMRAMVAATRAANARPVLCLAVPAKDAGTWRSNVELFNQWLARYARSEGIPLIDFHTPLVDPATGAYLSAYVKADLIHPNAAGAKLMGDTAAAILSKVISPWVPPLPTFQTVDSRSLNANALSLTDTNADGLCDGWSKTANATATNPTPGGTVLGKAQRIASTDTAQAFAAISAAAGTWSVGDTIAIVGRVSATMGTSVGAWTLQLNFTSATPNSIRPFNSWTVDANDHIFYREAVIPVGTTALTWFLSRTMSTVGNGTNQIAQFAILNLTTGGILTA